MSSSTLHVNFCYNSSIHGCISQAQPLDVAGLKSNKTVSKLLRAFCRGSGMQDDELDEQVNKLQIGKCFCHSGNQNRSSKLFSGDDPIESVGLVNGDYVFVKSIQPVFEEEDEEMEELQEDSKNSSSSTIAFPGSTGHFGHQRTESSIAKAQEIKSKISVILGGDQWLTTRFFKVHLAESPGLEYLTLLRSSINMCFLLDPACKDKKDGMFPSLLIGKLKQVTQQRLENGRSNQKQLFISHGDMKKVRDLLKVQLENGNTSEVKTPFNPRSTLDVRHKSQDEDDEDDEADEDDEEMETDQETYQSSSFVIRSNRSAQQQSRKSLSLAKNISACWNSDLWKEQRLRKGLDPISLASHETLGNLLRIANLTRCSSSNGFPPQVWKALQDALLAHECSGKTNSSKGWSQKPVVLKALEIIQKQNSNRSTPSTITPSSSSFKNNTGISAHSNDNASAATSLLDELQGISTSRIARDLSDSNRAEMMNRLNVLKEVGGQ